MQLLHVHVVTWMPGAAATASSTTSQPPIIQGCRIKRRHVNANPAPLFSTLEGWVCFVLIKSRRLLGLKAHLNTSTAYDMHEISEPKRAALLGMPPELRLKIYDEVLGFDRGQLTIHDPAHPLDHEWRFTYKDLWSHERGFGTRISRHDTSLPYISWLSLLSTCSVVRGELKGHMSTVAAAAAFQASSATDEAEHEAAVNTAWTYELCIAASYRKLTDAVFISLPCSPTDCRALTAHITLPRGLSFWGDGGPMPILRELYQTLNRFLHCGPVLDAPRPLSTGPLRLEELRIIVKAEAKSQDELVDGEESVFEEMAALRPRDTSVSDIGGFARSVEQTGLLDGLVRRIVVLAADDGEVAESDAREEVVMQVHEREIHAVPDYWKRYGFEWRVDVAAPEEG